MSEETRQKVAKVVIKHNLGHKDQLREDIGVLLIKAYEQGFQDALKLKPSQEVEEKPKKVKKAKE